MQINKIDFTIENLQAIKNEALDNPFRAIRMYDSNFSKIFDKLLEYLNNEEFFNSIKSKVIELASKGENFLYMDYSIKFRFCTTNEEDVKFTKNYYELSDTYLTPKMRAKYSLIDLDNKFEELIGSEFSSLINNYFHNKEKSDIDIDITSFHMMQTTELLVTFNIDSGIHERKDSSVLNTVAERTFDKHLK